MHSGPLFRLLFLQSVLSLLFHNGSDVPTYKDPRHLRRPAQETRSFGRTRPLPPRSISRPRPPVSGGRGATGQVGECWRQGGPGHVERSRFGRDLEVRAGPQPHPLLSKFSRSSRRIFRIHHYLASNRSRTCSSFRLSNFVPGARSEPPTCPRSVARITMARARRGGPRCLLMKGSGGHPPRRGPRIHLPANPPPT